MQNEISKQFNVNLIYQSLSGARVVYYVFHKGEARVLHAGGYTQVNH